MNRGFISELEKIAVVDAKANAAPEPSETAPEAPKEKYKHQRSTGAKVVGGIGGYMGANIAGLGGRVAGGNLVKPLMDKKFDKIDSATIRDLRKTMPSAAHSPVYRSTETAMGGAAVPKGGFMSKPLQQAERMQYSQMGHPGKVIDKVMDKGGILAGKAGPEILAHEMGHASAYGKGGLNRLHRILQKSRNPGNFAALLAAGAAAGGDTEGAAVKYAPLVGAAGASITPLEEGIASLRGWKGLKATGKYSPEAMKAMRSTLLRAGGSYAAPAAAMASIPALISAYRRRNIEG